LADECDERSHGWLRVEYLAAYFAEPPPEFLERTSLEAHRGTAKHDGCGPAQNRRSGQCVGSKWCDQLFGYGFDSHGTAQTLGFLGAANGQTRDLDLL